MDRQSLALLIPILALGIGLAATILGGMTKLAKVRAQERRAVDGGDVETRLEALEDEVSRLRHELTEAHERLDFAERVLARPPAERDAAR